jgi:hypothetical protein
LLLIYWCSGQICGDPLSFPFLLPFSHCSSCVWGLFGLYMALYTIGRHSTKKEGREPTNHMGVPRGQRPLAYRS